MHLSTLTVSLLLSIVSAETITLEEAKTNGMQWTLRNYIKNNENIVDICVYEQEWFNPNPKKRFDKGRLVQRAVVTHVYSGNFQIGTKLEYYYVIEEPPRILFKNFKSTVEGELLTFFFNNSDIQEKTEKGILLTDHWSFGRVDDVFSELFRIELRTNTKLKPKGEQAAPSDGEKPAN